MPIRLSLVSATESELVEEKTAILAHWKLVRDSGTSSSKSSVDLEIPVPQTINLTHLHSVSRQE